MLRIWCFPGEENRLSNPYTAILVTQLRRLGHTVSSPGWLRRFTGRCDVIHLHWPQKVVRASLFGSLRTIAVWSAFLALQKARGAKIVWTMHNVASHEGERPKLERFWMKHLIARLSGIHALSQDSLEQARAHYPALAALPALVAPHWTYSDAYPQPNPDARVTPGTIAFLGDIKAYKGLDAFLTALEQTEPDPRRYLVHGRPEDEESGRALEDRLQALAARGWRIEWTLERLSDQQMADRLAEADLLMLPYESGENSGLAVLAAERGTPLLVSRLAAFEPLLEELGWPRATAIKAPLTHWQIVAAAGAARSVSGTVPRDFVRRRSPEAVVAEISGYYLFLMDIKG
jgi:glycosyltransferase involved in cell wall biosynthesis